MISELLCDMIGDIILRNQELVSIAVRQRAKFEGWLKFELARTLRRYFKNTCVEYNVNTGTYGASEDDEQAETHKLVDIFFDNILLELKTPNTNYANPLCEDRTRPITKNIESILGDVKKLRDILQMPNLHGSSRGFIAFAMFPLDVKEKLYMAHIDKITKVITSHNSNGQPITKVIKLDNQIPILIYVAEVK